MRRTTGLVAATAIVAATTTVSGVAHADPSPAKGSEARIGARAVKLAAQHDAEIRSGEGQKLRATGVFVDETGTSHTRMSRTYRGLPVVGGDLIVHQTAKGRWAGVSQVLRSAPKVSTTPKVTAGKAQRAAVSAGYARQGGARLVVDARGGTSRLAWQVTTVGTTADGTPSRLVNTVDASTGKVLHRTEQITTLVERNLAARGTAGDDDARRAGDDRKARKGTGKSLYSGKVKLKTIKKQRRYRLTDPTRGNFQTRDMRGSDDFESNGKVFKDKNNKWGNGKAWHPQSAAADVHYGTALTWDYFKKKHVRNGMYNNGLGLKSRVHFGQDSHGYDNAFFDPAMDAFAYGDGYKAFKPLVALDVVAHENTHAVTYTTANLFYEGESGGLNESTSDIMGSVAEFYAKNPKDASDYYIGEKIVRKDFGRSALRYMDKPSRDGKSPDCWSPEIKDLNVHQSSGIGNHFFYLLSEGSGKKTINGVNYDSPTCDGAAVKGIGRDYAAKIWYLALRGFMNADTDYQGARDATVRAAATIYGPEVVKAVEAAWDAVNVKKA